LHSAWIRELVKITFTGHAISSLKSSPKGNDLVNEKKVGLMSLTALYLSAKQFFFFFFFFPKLDSEKMRLLVGVLFYFGVGLLRILLISKNDFCELALTFADDRPFKKFLSDPVAFLGREDAQKIPDILWRSSSSASLKRARNTPVLVMGGIDRQE
jgi:hypothetical protein